MKKSILLGFLALVLIVVPVQGLASQSQEPKYSVYPTPIVQLPDYSVAPTPVTLIPILEALPYNQVACLAANVYYEARGEPELGMLAVAQVTLNRVKSERFRNTICEVVFSPFQFSWSIKTKRIKYDALAWKIANDALYTVHKLHDFKSLHFHNHTVRPKWSYKIKKLRTIGRHTFYD